MTESHVYVFSWVSITNNFEMGNQAVVQDHEVCVDDIIEWSKNVQENDSLDEMPTIMFFTEVSK